MARHCPTQYIKGGELYFKDEFQGGKLVRADQISVEFFNKYSFVLDPEQAKRNSTAGILKSSYEKGGFVTSELTGDPVNIHSAKQEKALMKKAGLVYHSPNSKAKNRLNSKKNTKLPSMQPVNMKKQHRAVKDHFKDRKEHRTTFVKKVYDKYAKAKISDF